MIASITIPRTGQPEDSPFHGLTVSPMTSGPFPGWLVAWEQAGAIWGTMIIDRSPPMPLPPISLVGATPGIAPTHLVASGGTDARVGLQAGHFLVAYSRDRGPADGRSVVAVARVRLVPTTTGWRVLRDVNRLAGPGDGPVVLVTQVIQRQTTLERTRCRTRDSARSAPNCRHSGG